MTDFVLNRSLRGARFGRRYTITSVRNPISSRVILIVVSIGIWSVGGPPPSQMVGVHVLDWGFMKSEYVE